MSINDSAPVGPDDPDRDVDNEKAINPATSPAILASLADDRPALRAAVAANPSAPVHTLLWLRDLGEPTIDRALANNPTAVAANVVRRVVPLPPPVGAPATPSTIHAGPAGSIDRDPTPPQGISREPGSSGSPIVIGPQPSSRPSAPAYGRGSIPVAATLVGAAAGVAAAGTVGRAGAAPMTAPITTTGVGGVPPVASGSANGVGPAVTATSTTGNPSSFTIPPATPPGPPRLADSAEPPVGATRRSFATWAILLVPLLFAAGTVASWALFRDSSSKKQASVAPSSATSAAGTVRTEPTSTRSATTTTVTNAPTSTVDAAVVASTGDTTPPQTPASDAPDTNAPAPAPAPATNVPRRGATTVKPATSATSATTVRTTSPAPTAAKSVGTDATTTKAVNLAQQLATALADANWSTARTLSPTSTQTDAAYSKDYGDLTDSTVVPVSTSAAGSGVYNLRIGLVAHETSSAGVRRTVLFCSHWDVDTTTNTIKRVSGTRLRVATGRVEVATVRAELLASCASASLK